MRRSSDRGVANFGWLDSRHSFSFGEYYDPRHMGFRALRVINEDKVEPGRGFGTHPHRDMEIVSYVLEGQLAHKDSMGNGSVMTPGDVQRMSAGTGVLHSEFNPSERERVHFLQIWVEPDRAGFAPSYEQRRFEAKDKQGRLRVVASNDGAEGSVKWNADARLYASLLAPKEEAKLELAAGRHAWVQVVRGEVLLNGQALGAGDGAAISNEPNVALTGVRDAEVLLFDLA